MLLILFLATHFTSAILKESAGRQPVYHRGRLPCVGPGGAGRRARRHHRPPTEPTDEEPEAPEQFYPNVVGFSSNRLATSYRRQLDVQDGVTLVLARVETRLSQQPPRSPLARLGFLRLDETTGMSV